MNRVFPKRLVGRVDVDLHVDELEARIHLFVQEGEERGDGLGSFISGIDAEVGKVGELQRSLLSEQCGRFLGVSVDIGL
jgi:hypothetical protein